MEVRAPSPQPASAPASRGRAGATAWGWHHRRSVLTPSPQSRAHRRGLSRLRLTLGDGPAAATLGALAATAAAAPTGMDVADGAPPAWRLYCYSTTPALCSQAAPHPRSVNSYPIGTSLSQMARIFQESPRRRPHWKASRKESRESLLSPPVKPTLCIPDRQVYVRPRSVPLRDGLHLCEAVPWGRSGAADGGDGGSEGGGAARIKGHKFTVTLPVTFECIVPARQAEADQ